MLINMNSEGDGDGDADVDDVEVSDDMENVASAVYVEDEPDDEDIDE